MRVALFATCLVDRYFADAAADAVRLLRHLGVSVDVPPAQTCCGQPAYNAGHREEARRMARHTLAVFEGADHVVLPSGSCAGMLRSGYARLLEPHERAAVATLAAKTRELSEFVVGVLGIRELGTGLRGTRVAYHHGCHALRELGVDAEPVTLLRGAGAEVVPWAEDRECCGFGGLFSTKFPAVSSAMADVKLEALPPADVVTSADGGCLLQLSGRAARRGVRTDFTHLASLLWRGAA